MKPGDRVVTHRGSVAHVVASVDRPREPRTLCRRFLWRARRAPKAMRDCPKCAKRVAAGVGR